MLATGEFAWYVLNLAKMNLRCPGLRAAAAAASGASAAGEQNGSLFR